MSGEIGVTHLFPGSVDGRNAARRYRAPFIEYRLDHRLVGHYVVFVSLLVPFGMLMEAAGPQDPTPAAGSWPR
jgi:hypothetical protein